MAKQVDTECTAWASYLPPLYGEGCPPHPTSLSCPWRLRFVWLPGAGQDWRGGCLLVCLLCR